jgi:hypothetical protein
MIAFFQFTNDSQMEANWYYLETLCQEKEIKINEKCLMKKGDQELRIKRNYSN